ncbi:MAG: outer membrane beta-barrel protein [Bacteroidales bacterium]|nr:outer membrane beta-barrel protein [Bacteroidales bacterium]
MNRILLSAALLLLCAGFSASAQEEVGPVRVGVRVGYAFKPLTASDYFFGSFSGVQIGDTRLEAIYHDYHGPIWSTGTITATADIYINSWFFVGVNGGWAKFRADTFNGVTDAKTGTQEGSVCYVLPMANFRYLNRGWLRLYGGLGFGLGFYSEFFQKKVRIEPQFTPVGVEVGGKLFGFLEAGYGALFCGVRGGIGFNF